MLYYKKDKSGRLWRRNPVVSILCLIRDFTVFILPVRRLHPFVVNLLYGIRPRFVFFVHAEKTGNQYSEQKVIETVENEFGWKKPADTDSCSSNCLLNSLGIDIHRIRYGISPYAIPIARDIREGLVNREEALKTINAALNIQMVKDIAQKLRIDLETISRIK